MIDYALNFVIIFHSMFVIKEPIKINVSKIIFHITYKLK